MAFKSIARKMPRRLWALKAYANQGKSTLAGRMRGRKAIIDTDFRFDEVVRKLDLPEDTALSVVENPVDATDPVRIEAILKANMPNSGVETIIVDSLTGIIQPKVTAAISRNNQGADKNKSAVWAEKANSMRILLDSINRWNTDVLYIWHKEDRGFNGAGRIHETIPETEREAMTRALNMELELVTEGEGADRRFGVMVVWARNGLSGMTLWDEPGNLWKGMPERIEAAVYAEGVKADSFGGEDSVPPFASMADAINWAVDKGAYSDRDAARADYQKVKETAKPTTPEQMYNAWIPHVKGLLHANCAAA